MYAGLHCAALGTVEQKTVMLDALGADMNELLNDIDGATIARAKVAADMKLIRAKLIGECGEMRILGECDEMKQITAKLCDARAQLVAVVARLGGTVEGAPTAEHNFLQRIDELRRIEHNYLQLIGVK
jgi:hypothetical protein